MEIVLMNIDNELEENKKRKLNEENEQSKQLISNKFMDINFNSESRDGQIVIRTSNLFNVLSDLGYDIEVSFDNGESTNTIILDGQGANIIITITDNTTPLKAYLSGNLEITQNNIETMQEILRQIQTL